MNGDGEYPTVLQSFARQILVRKDLLSNFISNCFDSADTSVQFIYQIEKSNLPKIWDGSIAKLSNDSVVNQYNCAVNNYLVVYKRFCVSFGLAP
jgi:hypothetical protein